MEKFYLHIVRVLQNIFKFIILLRSTLQRDTIAVITLVKFEEITLEMYVEVIKYLSQMYI